MYLIVILSSEILMLAVIIWIASHSEFVTYTEFLSGIIVVFTAFTAGYWSLWSRLSQLSQDVGFIKGYMKQKFSEIDRGFSEIEKRLANIERHVVKS